MPSSTGHSSRSAAARLNAASLGQRRVQADAFLNLTRIQRVTERRVARLLEGEGLKAVTPAQANVLMILFQAKEPLTARVLAGQMEVSEVTVGRFVKALEGAGWIRRDPDPDDARAMLIVPTPKAYRALPRFIRVSNALLDLAFAGFGAGEIRRIATTGAKILDNLSAV